MSYPIISLCLQIIYILTRWYLYQLFHICKDIKGSFLTSTYGKVYRNYMERITKRVEAGRLDLNALYKAVMEEVTAKEPENDPDEVQMDEDELSVW